MNTILILHGWGWPVSSQQWDRVKELLESRGYVVFVPDLPGFGQTPPPIKPWAINDYVEWVKDFCEKHNFSQIFLLGHSFGGSVAAKFSVKYPQLVRKLILIGSAGIRRKRLKKEIQKKAAHFLNKFSFLPFYGFVRKIAYKTLFRHSDYLLTEGVMKETYLNIIKEDISEIFPNISVPTLLIWGKKDNIIPLEHAYFMKEKIPGVKLEIVPNVKHNPHREAPEILVEKILQFLP
ncbi:MAG: alpha/beta hydrolase [Candidatus Nealsonbacteria bacterium]|nr:alpha/beta hydrolase [Candidatus Nealsonbacteria bacterium]